MLQCKHAPSKVLIKSRCDVERSMFIFKKKASCLYSGHLNTEFEDSDLPGSPRVCTYKYKAQKEHTDFIGLLVLADFIHTHFLCHTFLPSVLLVLQPVRPNQCKHISIQ